MVGQDMSEGKRDAVGATTGTCDLCGRTTTELWLEPAAGAAEGSDSAEMVRVCAECRGRLAVDDLPYDAEIGAGLQAADE